MCMEINFLNYSPGAVKTNIARDAPIPADKFIEIFDSLGKKYPVGRCGEAVDIANTILYLASEQASFITGTIVVADGGHIAGNVHFEPE